MGYRETTCGIYALISEDDECLWIGQSVNVEKRYKRHLALLRTNQHRIKFLKWFEENERNESAVKIRLLEECDPEFLNEREGYWFKVLPPLFYGQLPSQSRKWFLSDEAKANISAGNKKAIARKKADGTFVSGYDRMVAAEGKEVVDARMKAHGFNSESAIAAGRNGNVGKPKSEEQKRRQSESSKKVAANILMCDECDRPCKGKSALGSHKRTHRSEMVA
jgi:hypothetical protein